MYSKDALQASSHMHTHSITYTYTQNCRASHTYISSATTSSMKVHDIITDQQGQGAKDHETDAVNNGL